MEKTKEIKREQQERYIEGLKRYSQRGIPIYIDGKECRAEDCERLFEVSEDGAFYMGDYVGADEGQLRDFLPDAPGMPMASRYLATVLREICTPCATNFSVSSRSLSGWALSSPSMMSASCFCTLLADTL